MKKILFTFGFVFLTFFSFNCNVHANVHTGISYDAHEKFNIFYEIKQNTPMANLLLSKDINGLSSYLGTSLAYVSIHYASDLEPYLLEGKTFPINTKYVIIYSSSDHDYTSILKKNGSSYTTSFRFININYQIAFFDNQANKLTSSTDYLRYYVGDTSPEFTYSFDGNSKKDIEDFSYFISHLWYYEKMYTEGLFEKTYVTDVIYNDERLLIDDSKVNENIFTKIKDFWLSLFSDNETLIDANQLNLKYFQVNSYMSDIKKPASMYSILNYNNSVIPPSGFKPLNFKYEDNSVDGYLFIPKNINNQTNRNLYGYTTDLPRKSFSNENIASVKQGVSGFSLNSNNSISALAEKNADYYVSYKENYQLYDLDYQTKLSNKYPDYKTTTTAIWVSHAKKYDSILYYNPNAFNVCPLYTTGTTTNDTGDTILTYNSCTFTNPVTNEEVTLSGDDFYNTISSTNTVGASPNIGITGDELDEYNKYNELWETDESGNLIGFSITSVLKQLHSFLTSFIAVITTIFASFTLFFNALPLEIRGLLYFSLIGGVILLFWKLIR